MLDCACILENMILEDNEQDKYLNQEKTKILKKTNWYRFTQRMEDHIRLSNLERNWRYIQGDKNPTLH